MRSSQTIQTSASVTTVVYRLLLQTVGLGTYMPYLALLALLHLIVVAEVYVLARRAAGLWVGVFAAVVVAFFGSGFENLFWAMQIGFGSKTWTSCESLDM